MKRSSSTQDQRRSAYSTEKMTVDAVRNVSYQLEFTSATELLSVSGRFMHSHTSSATMGTATKHTNVHATSGDSPSMRLETPMASSTLSRMSVRMQSSNA